MSLKDLAFWSKNRVFRRHALAEYRVAVKNEKLSRDELHCINWSKRKAIVAHAYKNSFFYRQFYKNHSLHPDDLQAPEDWRRVPALKKRDLAQRFDEIVDHHLPESRRISTTTGGSTGEPLRTIRDRRFPEEILKWRMLRRWSAQPSDDMLMLWRVPAHTRKLSNRAANQLLWWPTKRHKFDVATVDDRLLEKIAEILLMKRPQIIWGYVGAVESLAWFLERNSVELEYAPLVWVTAAPVSGIQWQLFERVFGSRVVDQYACSEIHWVAANVPGERALTVEFDYRHVDILKDDGEEASQGEVGRLLITDLHNMVFPLIKYEVGDRAATLECGSSAFSSFPRITPVKGRVTDAVRTPSGRMISGEYLTTIFDDCTAFIAQFQIFQAKDFSVTVRVRFRRRPTKTELSQLEGVIHNLLQQTGNEIPVEWVEAEDIAADAGKVRFVRSELMGGTENA